MDDKMERWTVTSFDDAAARIATRVREALRVDGADPLATQLLAFAAYAAGEIGLSRELMDRELLVRARAGDRGSNRLRPRRLGGG